MWNFLKKSKFMASKMTKLAVFELLSLPKLISHNLSCSKIRKFHHCCGKNWTFFRENHSFLVKCFLVVFSWNHLPRVFRASSQACLSSECEFRLMSLWDNKVAMALRTYMAWRLGVISIINSWIWTSKSTFSRNHRRKKGS